MAFWNKTKEVLNTDVSKLTRGAAGTRVGSVKVMISEFTNITNEFKLIEQNLKRLNELTIEEIQGLTSTVSWANLPMMSTFGAGIKKGLGMRQGQVTQMYYASQNSETFTTITQIHKFVDDLIKWLTNVSNITDTDQLIQYFGNGQDIQGSFSTTLVQLSSKIDEINKRVGATLNSDNILVGQTSKLSKLYDQVAVIVKTLNDSTSKISNIELFKIYQQLIMNEVTVALQEKNEFDSQIKRITSIEYFNEFMCWDYLNNLSDVTQNQIYVDKLKTLISSIDKNDFISVLGVKKYIESSVGAVRVEPIISNMLEDKEIVDMIKAAETITVGNPGVHQHYVNFINRFLTNKPFDETVKIKLILINEAVIRDILTLPVNDSDVDKYAPIFDDIFRKFDSIKVKTAVDAENLVKHILNAYVPLNS
jgi:hypothetical protein